MAERLQPNKTIERRKRNYTIQNTRLAKTKFSSQLPLLVKDRVDTSDSNQSPSDWTPVLLMHLNAKGEPTPLPTEIDFRTMH